MRARWHPITIVFLCLAVFGLIYQLYHDPKGLFTMILIFSVVFLIFYALYRYLYKEHDKYKKAAAKQRVRNRKPLSHLFTTNQSSHSRGSQTSWTKKDSRKRVKNTRIKHSFTVIEGNKDKKKDPYSS